MKKLYFFLCGAMMCLGANAAELTVYMGETPITPGQTVEFKEGVVEDMGKYNAVTFDPELSVASDVATSALTVTANCTSGQKIQMCAGGQCEFGTSVTKTGVKLEAGKKLKLRFDYVADLAIGVEIPTVTTDFELQDGTDADSNVKFTIVMSAGKSSLTLLEVAKELRYEGSALVYNVEGTAALALYNAEGRAMLQTEVAGEGTVSTAGLPAGIYVYVLGDKTGKIYIR